MLDLMASLAWCAVAVYAVRRTAEVGLRAIAVWERNAPIPPAPEPVVDVPNDLVAVAMQEREAWAQEEVLRAMREKYELSKDWNMVRRAFDVGAM
jgi:hypothetical protein